MKTVSDHEGYPFGVGADAAGGRPVCISSAAPLKHPGDLSGPEGVNIVWNTRRWHNQLIQPGTYVKYKFGPYAPALALPFFGMGR